jgi:hypothetical protein
VEKIENRLEEVTIMTLEEFYERLNYDQRLKLINEKSVFINGNLDTMANTIEDVSALSSEESESNENENEINI